MSVTISAQAMDAALRQRLAPTRLEVIDESYQHAGHAGANDSGVGTHYTGIAYTDTWIPGIISMITRINATNARQR